MNDAGTLHVMENPSGHMQCAEECKPNKSQCVHHLNPTLLLTFKIIRALLTYQPLFLILMVLFYYPIEKLSLCFS